MLVGLLVLLQGCSYAASGGGRQLQLSGIAADPPAEQLAELDQPSFENVLVGFAGRGIIVNVWASWCGACQGEAPLLRRAHNADGGSVAFIGVDSRDGRRPATQFLDQSDIRYPNIADPSGAIARWLGSRGLPTTVISANHSTTLGHPQRPAHRFGPARHRVDLAALLDRRDHPADSPVVERPRRHPRRSRSRHSQPSHQPRPKRREAGPASRPREPTVVNSTFCSSVVRRCSPSWPWAGCSWPGGGGPATGPSRGTSTASSQTSSTRCPHPHQSDAAPGRIHTAESAGPAASREPPSFCWAWCSSAPSSASSARASSLAASS